jgi:hypothetical protein
MLYAGCPRFAALPAGVASVLGRDSDVADYRHQREEEHRPATGRRCCITIDSTSAVHESSSLWREIRRGWLHRRNSVALEAARWVSNGRGGHELLEKSGEKHSTARIASLRHASASAPFLWPSSVDSVAATRVFCLIDQSLRKCAIVQASSRKRRASPQIDNLRHGRSRLERNAARFRVAESSSTSTRPRQRGRNDATTRNGPADLHGEAPNSLDQSSFRELANGRKATR